MSSPGPPAEACCGVDRVVTPELFKALGEGNRLALFARLAECGRACTVSELARCLTVDVSVVSRHLALLREAGILEAEKRGKQVYYSVRYDVLVRTLRDLADAIERCCPDGRPQRDQATPVSARAARGGRAASDTVAPQATRRSKRCRPSKQK